MLPNSELIISDTSCLILLNKIDELNLLKQFGLPVFITSTISKEFRNKLPEWIEIKDPNNKHYQKILELDIDKGEASAIALALEMSNSILIIDDLKGRKISDKLNLKYSGTFGLILRAKQEGIINNAKDVLNKIRKTNFRFSENLFKTIISEAGENSISD
jgi:predicted nucleic acid-binding protein